MQADLIFLIFSFKIQFVFNQEIKCFCNSFLLKGNTLVIAFKFIILLIKILPK